MKFWDKYWKAFNKEQKGKLSVQNSMLKKPTLWLVAMLAIGFFAIFAIYSWATYVPPTLLPTMTVGGFFDELITVQNPFWLWVFIFLFFWLTKW